MSRSVASLESIERHGLCPSFQSTQIFQAGRAAALQKMLQGLKVLLGAIEYAMPVSLRDRLALKGEPALSHMGM